MNNDKEPKWVRFVAGGAASCTAEMFTLPIDTVKVRLQVQAKSGAYNGMFDAFSKIVRNEGVFGLWKGLSPALLRQSCYSSLRMGVYEPIRNIISGGNGNGEPKFWQRLLAGGTAGAFGISVANPTELIKIRMQADKSGTRYNGLFHAFRSIIKTEGVFGLWTGLLPNVQRAFIINAVELATYDQTKSMLVKMVHLDPNVSTTHFAASFITGFCAALASSPIDVVKNRLMSQDKVVYRGMMHAAMKISREEGRIRPFYQGFFPLWLRLGPWCIIMFMSYEKYREATKIVWE